MKGIFVDKNYSVELKNSIIICTSNYENVDETRDNLGLAIFNRFDGFIKFEKFSENDCRKIISFYYKKYFENLDSSKMALVEQENVK